MLKVLLILTFSSIILNATTYYVSPQGNNFNDGTINTPFATVQRALDTAEPNDSIMVLEGHYIINSGLNIRDDSISLNCIGNVVLDGTFSNVNKKFIDFRHHNYVKLNGLTLTNIAFWGIWIDGNFNEVKNCKVLNVRYSGICVIEASYNLVSNNVVHKVGTDSTEGNSITIESKVDSFCNFTSADFNIIEYNKISLNRVHFGINLDVIYSDTSCSQQFVATNNILRYNQIDSCWTGIYIRSNQNFDIYGNIIAYSDGISIQNEGYGIKLDYGSKFFVVDAHGRIYNNTIAWCYNTGLFNVCFKNLHIYNNAFYQNNSMNFAGSGYIRFDNITGIQLSNNAYFGNNLYFYWNDIRMNKLEWQQYEVSAEFGDPSFVDPVNDNYYLTENSALRGTGLNLVELDTFYNNRDILNRIRPSSYNLHLNVWDIGAYEYYGALTNVSDDKITLDEYYLYNNYPNPFNPTTIIKFYLPENSFVKLKILDILGQKVSEGYNEVLEKGEHTYTFNASILSSGIYLYQLESINIKNGSAEILTKKMMLIK
ncbi:MAG TPA: right-handed parallel beta-helix repeat-containing protein [Ignavibacteriaceae bacterium]|nr:right-handed parallel beta-helix repeat-containing protein [Ignavibacteriaceae bacterium]